MDVTVTTNAPDKTRALLMVVREALLLILGALEDYLGVPRTKQRGRNA